MCLLKTPPGGQPNVLVSQLALKTVTVAAEDTRRSVGVSVHRHKPPTRHKQPHPSYTHTQSAHSGIIQAALSS